MKYQRRAAIISLGIHGVFIATAAGLAALTVPVARVITIDFTIEKPSPVRPESASMVPLPKPSSRHTQRPAPPPPVKEEVAFPDTTAQDTTADTTQFTAAESSIVDNQPVQVASIGPISLPEDTGKIREKERQRYLKEQFEYIRNIIYRKANYPPAALEMNITGTVLLSFCVCENGGIESIDVLKGSGAPILDRDAVATVRRAAPFPRPPVRVVVKFPFEYRLE